MVVRFLVACAALAGACNGEGAALEADAAHGLVDAGAEVDGMAAQGFGDISGQCNVLDEQLSAPTSGLFEVQIAFDRLYTDADRSLLSAGGDAIMEAGTAGGSSLLSEVFAFEVLHRCEMAALLKTETEIVYDTAGKLTDFLAMIDAEKIGVSVTRAVAFPFDQPYPVSSAEALLEDKLADILESSENVSAADSWRKQILAVLAYGPSHASALVTAFNGIDEALRADTLVMVIQTDGSDDFIYCDGVCQ